MIRSRVADLRHAEVCLIRRKTPLSPRRRGSRTLQIIAFTVHPSAGTSRIQILEEGQAGVHVVGLETRRREEIEILGGAVAELKRHACTTIEHEVWWYCVQFRPQSPLRFRQDVQARLERGQHL